MHTLIYTGGVSDPHSCTYSCTYTQAESVIHTLAKLAANGRTGDETHTEERCRIQLQDHHVHIFYMCKIAHTQS
jgi:hypothetical protein